MELKIGNRTTSIFYLLMVYATYIFYYISDMKTSANIIVKQTESRGSVHIFMFLLICVLAIYFVVNLSAVPNIGINIPILLLAGWMIVVDVINESSIWNIAVRVGLFVLWFLVSIFAAGYIKSEVRYHWVLRFEFIIWCITVYYSFQSIKNYASYSGTNQTNVLNISYNILVLIPFLMQIKNRLIRNLSCGLSIILIIVSMKRGAIITMAAMLLIYFFIVKRVSGKSLEKRLLGKILLIIILVCICIFAVDTYTNGYFSSRFTKDSLISGSNRNELYSLAWQDISGRSIIDFVIGKGSSSVLEIIGSGVHNEVLEFLFSYGLIGLLSYLFLIVNGIKKTVFLIRKKTEGAAYYGMSMAFIILVGMVGSALFSHYTFHIMLLAGISNSYLEDKD